MIDIQEGVMSSPENERDPKPAAKLSEEEDLEDLEAPAQAQEDVVGGMHCGSPSCVTHLTRPL